MKIDHGISWLISFTNSTTTRYSHHHFWSVKPVIEILSCACMSWIAGGLFNLKASMLAFAQKWHAALLCFCLLQGSLGDLGPLCWSFLFGSHCNHIGSGEPEGGFQLLFKLGCLLHTRGPWQAVMAEWQRFLRMLLRWMALQMMQR